MPPANSPVATSPHRTDSSTSPRTPSPSFQSILREIGSPVQDLASTLTVQAEDDADLENMSFLRTPVEPPDEVSRETLSQQLRTRSRQAGLRLSNSTRGVNDVDPIAAERGTVSPASEAYNIPAQIMSSQSQPGRHRADRRVSQYQPLEEHSPWTSRMMSQAYGDRVPNQQSLYDWAPATDEGDDEELEDIIAELREQQPNTHPEILRVLGRAHLDAERETRNRGSPSRLAHTGQGPTSGSHQEPPSLRSAAILQSVRRNHRFSARSRDLMQRYVLGRERTLEEHDIQDRSSTSRYMRAAASASNSNRYEFNRLAWQASQRPAEHVPSHNEMVEYLQRRQPHEASLDNPSDFEKVIQHLYARKPADPASEGFVFEKDKKMSVLKKTPVTPPPPTSFLAPGIIFSGFQQATAVNQVTSSGATLHRLANNHARGSNTFDPNTRRGSPDADASRPWLTSNLTATPTFSASSSPVPRNAHRSSGLNTTNHDRWTVKVAVHNVDYEKMTLQGTMEAYNVASEQDPIHANDKTFSTYLEGELIDFHHHTLLTESFRATSFIDSTYWRKLEPFATMTDSEIGRSLLDPEWINRELLSKYVLMRWKEKCFVETTLTSAAGVRPGAVPRGEDARQDSLPTPPQRHGSSTATYLSGADNQNGLSISGFYYISLRRKDGRLEGLYFDPQSSPYQHLELRPEAGRWGQGAWEFR